MFLLLKYFNCLIIKMLYQFILFSYTKLVVLHFKYKFENYINVLNIIQN